MLKQKSRSNYDNHHGSAVRSPVKEYTYQKESLIPVLIFSVSFPLVRRVTSTSSSTWMVFLVLYPGYHLKAP
jgi:hypothetical protein